MNFKNYQDSQLSFHPQVNCLIGLNGMGKTNLLDSLYILCLTKSHFNLTDQQLIKEGAGFYRLQAHLFHEGQNQKLVMKCAKHGRKDIELEEKLIERVSDFVGKFPVVFFGPDDQKIIQGGGGERRKYLDNTISQYDAIYLHKLLEYNKLLKHRNASLLKYRQNGVIDHEFLEVLEEKLIQAGSYILQERLNFVHWLKPMFESTYHQISGEREEAIIEYKPNVNLENWTDLMPLSRHKDMILGRTSLGPHKDDLDIQINRRPVRPFASQGQMKSCLVALKKCQLLCLQRRTTSQPILLIDDIFDKLDQERIYAMLAMIKSLGVQTFISHTNAERIHDLFDHQNISYKLFYINNGAIVYEEAQ